MTLRETPLNVGALLRDGIRLTAAEAVAIVHGVCTQVTLGRKSAVAQDPDQISITGEGRLEMIGPVEATPRARAAVATLLQRLLPRPTEEVLYAVPNALRTLPARLLESGDDTDNELNDLLLILSRYLPSSPRDVLRQLAGRVREKAAPAPIERSAKSAVVVAEGATNPIAVEDAVADLPLHIHGMPEPQVDRRVNRGNPAKGIAVLVVLLAASGFLGYYFTARGGGQPPVAVTAEPRPEGSAKPRIIERDRPDNSSEATRALGTPVPLILPVANGAFSPSFAANNTLLFHAGRNSSGQLFATTLDPDGKATATKPLITDPARNYHPRLSPDGRRVAFDSDRDGERAVYVAELNGGQATRVSGQGYAVAPSWSPDGKLLAFIKAEPDRPRVWNLWLLDQETGESRRHTSFPIGQVWSASWFPDGRKLAYSHEDRLIVSDLNSGAQEVYLSPVKGRLIRTPAVSPDATTVVFQVYRDGVWMLDLKTGAMSRVLDDATAEEFAWDPEGRRIAYHSRRGGEWRIWVINA